MTVPLTERLNQILPKITSDDFLSGRGLGNEIAFYIFDYPPEEELQIREHVQFLLEHIPKQRPDLRVRHLNLFDFVLDYLRARNLLDKAIEMQENKGDEALLRALSGPLHENKLVPFLAEAIQPDQQDLILVSGVGGAWPLLRLHTLLNNLHSVVPRTPMVTFYPGKYDGQSLRLFGRLPHTNYYRAFKFAP